TPRAGRRCSTAPLAESAQLQQMAEDAVARVAPHFPEGALQRQRVEFARVSTSHADDGVMAALLAFRAGSHGGGPEHAMQQTQLEQRGEIAVDRDAIDGNAATAQLAVQLARTERAAGALQQIEQGAARRGDPPAALAQCHLCARREVHRRSSSTVATVLHQGYTAPVDWTALATAFGLIFVAELPDKTAATVVLLASR